MTDNKVKKQNETFQPSTIAAVVTGAIVGAGVAVAGALVLKDEKNRKTIKNVLGTVKDQVVGYAETLQDKTGELKTEITETVTDYVDSRQDPLEIVDELNTELKDTVNNAVASGKAKINTIKKEIQ